MAKSRNNSDKPLTVLCRPAEESDTPDILELTRHIWDGEDYVPRVWRDWLADTEGLLAVAVSNHRVIGLSKLTKLAHENWWMEGLRVHPKYQGFGVATQLHDYLLQYWNEHGDGRIRLATSSERVQVHNLCHHTGFVQIAKYCLFKATSLDDGDSLWMQISKEWTNSLLDTFDISHTINKPHQLIDIGWQWTNPDRDLIQEAVLEGRAYRWKTKNIQPVPTLFYWLDDWENSQHQKNPVPMIMMLDCPNELLTTCLIEFRKLACLLGFQEVGWLAPGEKSVNESLNAGGFKPAWDGTLLVFEKG